MSAAALLDKLRSLGAQLWVENGGLRYIAPKGILTPELLDEMRRGKDGLVAILRTLPDPSSFAQERLWFLDQLEPGGARYQVPSALRLDGELDSAALRSALTQLVTRHEALRTRFVAGPDGRPVAVVDEPAPAELSISDVSHHADPSAEAARLASEATRAPFRLDRGPLLRVRLLRLAPQAHVFWICIHHIVVDGWSLGILFGELSHLYSRYSRGLPDDLPPVPQPGSFARAQRRWMSTAACSQEEAWWAARLAGAPAEHAIPLDRPRPVVPGREAGRVVVTLAPDLGPRIASLGRREGATPFMVVLAALFALMHRWSGEADCCLGCPVAGRDRPEWQQMVGFLVNTLVYRETVLPDERFGDLLGRVCRSVVETLSRQELPFDRVVEVSGAARRPGVNPLFQVMLSYDNMRKPALRMGDLIVGRFDVPYLTSKFDLTFEFEDGEDGLRAAIEYDAALFDPASVARLGAQLGRMLAAVVDDPMLPVADIALASAAERRMMLAAGAGPALPVVPPTLLEAFAARAAAAPDAPAILAGDEELTYAALASCASRLARRLTAGGVRSGDLVGLCLERSVAAVVSMLAIWQAGAAWVPLDPAGPPDRLRLVLQDAAPRHLLTLEDNVPRLTTTLGRTDISIIGVAADCIEAGIEHPAWLAGGAGQIGLEAGAVAYVIYTSGSTGKPKGVVVTHANLANLCVAVAHRDRLVADDRVLHFASTQFDVALEEIAPTLWAGAALTPWEGGEAELDPRAFVACIARQRLTILNLPTAYWHLLADTTLPECVRLCIVGGEAASPEALRRWRRHNSLVAWANAYGPTEATVTATTFMLSPSEAAPPEGGRLPIGRPLANIRAWVLDAGLRPVAPGIPGELYIGGAGVAQGYRGQPEVTAERFPRLFLPGEPATRVYRTGDRARWTNAGQLQFLGRRDHQVKLRGFRIELAEVEQALLSHPAVTEAVVALRRPDGSSLGKGGQGFGTEGELIAWYATTRPAAAAPTQPALRDHLRARLPRHMIPAHISWLEDMPRTAGGKTDRAALMLRPHPVLEPSETALSGLEARILPVWEELLGRHGCGRDDDFFALGGHSLLAVQLVHRLRALLDRAVPIALLLQHPTLRGLAAALDTDVTADRPTDCLDTLQPLGNRPPLVLTPGGDGNSIGFLGLAAALGADQPVSAFHTPGLDGEGSGIQDLVKLAAHFCAALQSSGARTANVWIGGWSMGGVVALEMGRQLHAGGSPPRGVIVLDGFFFEEALAIDRRISGEARVQATLASNDMALMGYRPHFELDLDLHYVEPADDVGSVSRAEVRRHWQAMVRRPIRFWSTPGNHFTMLRAPHAAALAEVIRAIVDGACPCSPSEAAWTTI